MRARLEPGALQDRRQRAGRRDDDVGPAHRGLRLHRLGAVFLREALGVRGRAAPHAHLREPAHPRERLQMRVRLHAAADERQHARVGRRDVLGHRGRDGGGAHLGDQSPVHRRDRLARVGPHEHDHRVVGGNAAARVAGIEAHELGAHRFLGHGRHGGDVALALLDGENVAHRLNHASARKRGERRFHRRDQLVPAQQPANIVFTEVAHEAVLALSRLAPRFTPDSIP